MVYVVIFAYYEKSPLYKDNLEYFLQTAKTRECDDTFIYIVVVNGTHTIDVSKYPECLFYERPNTGFDFAGYFYGLRGIDSLSFWGGGIGSIDGYFFLNASCRGPFLPTYYKGSWIRPFLDVAKKENAYMVSSTINILEKYTTLIPSCQTYAFYLHPTVASYLVSSGFASKIYNDMQDVVMKQELGLSVLCLNNGWNISCLVPEYQRDYVAQGQGVLPNPFAKKTYGDICFPGGLCYGRDIHPYEVVFFKTNYMGFTNMVASLSHAPTVTAVQTRNEDGTGLISRAGL
jgi:hypothetical protein